jgi:hypothetical protein
MDIQELVDVAEKLPASKQSFAYSLISQARRGKTLSAKQVEWVGKLIDMVKNPAPQPEREKFAVGDLAGVVGLFDKAARNLKYPAIVLHLAGECEGCHECHPDSMEIRLSVAGETARVPGSINVKDNGGERTWFGRILRDGMFEKSPRAEMPQGLIELLQRFAKDPAKVAKEHALLTGRCCFCNTALTDERSTAAGFGPVCADHYGLKDEWKAAVAVLKQAA